MSKDNSNFEDLEKQLAKDTLEKTLKGLHAEITKDIEKNKATFSKEIQKTLNAFKTDLEDTISKKLDQRISAHLKNNFLDLSTKVTSSFYETEKERLSKKIKKVIKSKNFLLLFFPNSLSFIIIDSILK